MRLCEIASGGILTKRWRLLGAIVLGLTGPLPTAGQSETCYDVGGRFEICGLPDSFGYHPHLSTENRHEWTSQPGSYLLIAQIGPNQIASPLTADAMRAWAEEKEQSAIYEEIELSGNPAVLQRSSGQTPKGDVSNAVAVLLEIETDLAMILLAGFEDRQLVEARFETVLDAVRLGGQ